MASNTKHKSMISQKKIFALLILTTVYSVSILAQHYVPFISGEPAEHENNMPKGGKDIKNSVFYIHENFIFFTEGSESDPRIEGISDPQTHKIPLKYTRTIGWTGQGVSQAGGLCALHSCEDGGWIETPLKKMPGELQISIKMRIMVKKTIPAEGITLRIYINKGGKDCYAPIHIESFVFTDHEWKECSFSYINTSTEEVFVGVGELGVPILVDHIRIEGKTKA